MDPGDQDAKHPLLDHTPLRPYDTTLHRPYSHLQANPAHAVSQPGHLTLPPPPGQAPRSSVPIQPSYHRPGPPPSSGPPRAFPQPNNNPSPPTGTSHSDPRYSPPTAHPHGVTYQRSYSVDSGVQRSTNLPAQPGGEGRPPVSAGGLPSSEALGPSMDHHVPHGPPYVEHPPPNGMVHGSQHGMPLLPHHEQYPQHPQGGPPPGVPHGYAPPPPQYAATPYPQAPYPHQQATQFPRKKANRATQVRSARMIWYSAS